MNEPRALYALRDRRTDGALRELARFADPSEARAAREALRGAGDTSAEVAILPAVDPLEQEVPA